MLLLVSLTSFVRQSWNFGVASLCFWLFLENLSGGIDAIIWADNADIGLYVYCDIVTHIQEIASFVKPMATLIITRRLYLITKERSVAISDAKTLYRDTIIEWTLVLVIPILLSGPVYYVVQFSRFQVFEGFGCADAEDNSVLDILLLWSWSVMPPLISITIYYPRLAGFLYRTGKPNSRLLDSHHSISRANHLRMFTFASLDLLLTLPSSITNLVLFITSISSRGPQVFYPGWTFDHTEWAPVGFSYLELMATGPLGVAQLYFNQWTAPILAFAIFGLFGVTSEARASYQLAIYAVGDCFGWKTPWRAHEGLSIPGDIESQVPPLDTLVDPELRSRAVDSTPDNSLEWPVDISKVGKPATCNLQDGLSADPTKEPVEGPGHTTGDASQMGSSGRCCRGSETYV
ncbi:unnamed protein product [Peniophora sp. CBMAI 1063]|nr:unnamed protein product [Peniophora sp. CBMAI 1063]